MKQVRWIIALGIAVVVLVGIFLFVDHRTKTKQQEQAETSGPKTLFAFDGNDITRIVIDNNEGHFAFDWDSKELTWKLVSSEQFEINAYAVSAIASYFCDLSSLKTVEADCKDPAAYGFDNPVKICVYTTATGSDNPYMLTVGNPTPTNDAYYAMADGSNEVYTINYTSGSVFCAAKNTLKNTYLFDTTVSQVNYYKVETDGKVQMETRRGSDYVWDLIDPEGFSLAYSKMDTLMDTITRATLSSFVEENPDDLTKYGLDHPHTKVWLEGVGKSGNMNVEIWFGDGITDNDEETEIYGYFVNSKQVFTIKRSEIAFTQQDVLDCLIPYCEQVSITDLDSVEIDMGDVYDMKETLLLDYDGGQYQLGDTDIDALGEDVLDLFAAYYRSIINLSFTGLDVDAKPDPDKEPVITIIYHFKDGTDSTLTFTEKEENNYYLFKNGAYTGSTVRLNRFSASGGVIETYKALKEAL